MIDNYNWTDLIQERLKVLNELEEPRRWCREPPFERVTLFAYPDWETFPPKLALLQYDQIYTMEYYFQMSLLSSTRWLSCTQTGADLFYIPLFNFRITAQPIHERVLNATGGSPPPVNQMVLFEDFDSGGCGIPLEYVDAIWVTSLGALHRPTGSEPCHRLGKHVVAPGNEQFAHLTLSNTLDRVRMGHQRTLMFTFYGKDWNASDCFGSNARGAVLHAWSGREDINFSVGTWTKPGKSSNKEMENSVFCGAPHGCGWGSRLSKCILRGSIPVILQDESVLPFEPFLDYSTFAVRVPLQDIPRLDEILFAVTPAEIASKQQKVLEVAPYFVWDTAAGGQAFEGVMQTVSHIHRARQAGLLAAPVGDSKSAT